MFPKVLDKQNQRPTPPSYTFSSHYYQTKLERRTGKNNKNRRRIQLRVSVLREPSHRRRPQQKRTKKWRKGGGKFHHCPLTIEEISSQFRFALLLTYNDPGTASMNRLQINKSFASLSNWRGRRHEERVSRWIPLEERGERKKKKGERKPFLISQTGNRGLAGREVRQTHTVPRHPNTALPSFRHTLGSRSFFLHLRNDVETSLHRSPMCLCAA